MLTVAQISAEQADELVPGSVLRIAENFDIFDFELSTDELAQIDALDTGVRSGPEPADINLDNDGVPIPEA